MTQTLYYLSELLPYLILFPLLSILLLIVLKVIFKNGMNDNIALYGLFLDFPRKDVLLLALVFLQFLFIIETMVLNEFSYVIILFVFTPILLYGIISLDLVNMIMNILGDAFLLVLCFFKNIFLSYFLQVSTMWYVLILFFAVCLFILVIDMYLLIRNIDIISKRKIKKKRKTNKG